MTVWHRGGDFDSSLATTSAGGSAEGRAVGRSLSGGRVESEIWRWNRHANHQQPPGNDDRNKKPEEMNSDDVSHCGCLSAREIEGNSSQPPHFACWR